MLYIPLSEFHSTDKYSNNYNFETQTHWKSILHAPVTRVFHALLNSTPEGSHTSPGSRFSHKNFNVTIVVIN